MLTRKQYDLLCFIDRRLNETGISPSFDEMREALDLKSKSGIHRLIKGLEERGFLRRLPNRARALEVVRHPDNQTDLPSSSGNVGEHAFSPKVIRGDFTPSITGVVVDATAATAVTLPLPGKIAAGTPITALNDTTQIDVPASFFTYGSREHYALTVEGESMVEAGILDGDIAIIERCEKAENGEIVVALIDNEEATLKRLRKRGESIALEPANRHYKTMIYGIERIHIQGRLIGLMRRY